MYKKNLHLFKHIADLTPTCHWILCLRFGHMIRFYIRFFLSTKIVLYERKSQIEMLPIIILLVRMVNSNLYQNQMENQT